MKYTLALLATLLPSMAVADSLNMIKTFDEDTFISLFAYTTDNKDGVHINAFSTKATQVAIRGDGVPLTTCPGSFCQFTWTKAAMQSRKCVQCELIVTVTEVDGKSYRIKTEVIRP
jgi:hypothetical protein